MMDPRSDPGDNNSRSKGGGLRGAIVLIAVAGGAAVVFAGASVLRRWWTRRSLQRENKRPAICSTQEETVPSSSDTEILVYISDEIIYEEKVVDFDGLTVTWPSKSLCPEVLNFIVNNMRPDEVVEICHNFGITLSKGTAELAKIHINKSSLKKIDNLLQEMFHQKMSVLSEQASRDATCANNDDGLKKSYVYNNGGVIIEELDDDYESEMLPIRSSRDDIQISTVKKSRSSFMSVKNGYEVLFYIGDKVKCSKSAGNATVSESSARDARQEYLGRREKGNKRGAFVRNWKITGRNRKCSKYGSVRKRTSNGSCYWYHKQHNGKN